MRPSPDARSHERKERDEAIAVQLPLPPAKLPPGTAALPVEDHLARLSRKPVALPGIVENGLIRLLDSTVTLPEHARVIIVTTDAK